jgi:hypothetical protein
MPVVYCRSNVSPVGRWLFQISVTAIQDRTPGPDVCPMSSFGRTEIIRAKDPHTRIKPLVLASGHGRYITATPERTPVSVGKWPFHIITAIKT